MKVVITGANGQLGRALKVQFGRKHEVFAFSRLEMDVTNLSQLKEKLDKINPEVIIHAGAFTAVDEAERSPKKAYEINSIGSYYVAICAEQLQSKLVYVSTDYVFDGKKSEPYEISDVTNPLNVYGKSKLFGEQFILGIVKDAYIVRTSWLYGLLGTNFANTMIDKAKNNHSVTVVKDQVGSPTYTKDLAVTIEQVIKQNPGIYHVSNSGHCSWYDFAKEIYRLIGSDPLLVEPITTAEYSAIANRPHYSVLSTVSLQENNIPNLRNWKTALKEFISEQTSHGQMKVV